ncbi:MAG: hypothetical protein GY732_13990, partial [Gammaproteobacteria bacterium]|nr:hypothetical protein [Gammaproteobacteria bacterium]
MFCKCMQDAGDVLLNTQTTDGSGIYDFTGLPDGEHIVDVTDTGNVLVGLEAMAIADTLLESG